MYDSGRQWDTGQRRSTPEQQRVENEVVGRHMIALPDLVADVPVIACTRFDLDVGGLVSSPAAPSVAQFGEDVMVSVQGFATAAGAAQRARTALAVLDGEQLYSRSLIDGADGVEAPRLFVCDGGLWAIGSELSGSRSQAVVLRLEGARVSARSVIASARQERNWVPVPGGLRPRFVYSTDPLVVVEAGTGGVPAEVVQGSVRGGSQLLPDDAGYVAVVRQVHQSERLNTTRHVHRFARFDSGLTKVALGRPFSFTGDALEFCGGAMWRTVRGARQLLAAVGIGGNRSVIAVVAPETVTEYLT